MNTAVITIKTPLDVKADAQAAAKALGFSLSSLINGYLRQLIKTKTVHFSLEEPSPYLLESLRQSEKDKRRGDVSPTFSNAKDAINWLNQTDHKYVSDIQQDLRKAANQGK